MVTHNSSAHRKGEGILLREFKCFVDRDIIPKCQPPLVDQHGGMHCGDPTGTGANIIRISTQTELSTPYFSPQLLSS
jgi:hypothetical protein